MNVLFRLDLFDMSTNYMFGEFGVFVSVLPSVSTMRKSIVE